MFVMDTMTRVLFYVFLTGTLLGLGLKVGKDELLSVIRDMKWLGRLLVANFLLIPAVGVLAAKTLTMKPGTAVPLILLACAPGGMGALQFLSKKKEATALAYGEFATVLLSFLSILISPVLISLALPKGMMLTVPYGRAVLFLSLFMLLPLIVGIAVHRMAAAAARKLAGPVALIGTLAFIGVVVKQLALTKWAKGEMGKTGLIGIVLFILISMLIGWLLGGPRKFTRTVLATISSIRNVALAMAIAIRSFPDFAILTPLVAFGAIMVPANALFLLISKVAAKLAEKRGIVKDQNSSLGARTKV
jgi:BASS family bile acid:Na+ symporter